jgi:SAM-dependent methyltransferase
MCAHYLYLVASDPSRAVTKEGFTGAEAKMDDTLSTWRTDPLLIYDEDYAAMYDQLTQGQARLAAQTALCIKDWKKISGDLKTWSVLDVGAGTGYACQAFAKMGVGKVVGLDSSPPMLRKAAENLEQNRDLDNDQHAAITWRQDSAYNASACSLAEFSHVVVFYFSIYYMKDKELFFRHLHAWTKPGARMAVEVVNKHKFDPMLEAANPFVFSMQKYADQRLKKSTVKFNRMEYEGVFDLDDDDDNKAEFREIIRYTDTGVVRKQKHQLHMSNIVDIIADAERAHWKYIGFQDLLPVGFEYAYLLMFSRDDSV